MRKDEADRLTLSQAAEAAKRLDLLCLAVVALEQSLKARSESEFRRYWDRAAYHARKGRELLDSIRET